MNRFVITEEMWKKPKPKFRIWILRTGAPSAIFIWKSVYNRYYNLAKKDSRKKDTNGISTIA